MPNGARPGFLPTFLRAAVPASDFDDSSSIIVSGFQQRTGGEMSLVPIRSRAYDSQGAVTIPGSGELVPIQSVPRGTD